MQIGKSEGTWVEVIDWGEFKSFRKLFWIGRYRNTFWTGQFESFTFLGCVQTDATTPNLRCIVGRIQPIGLCKPCVISVRGPNNAGSVCMGLPTLLGPRTLITHGLQRLMGCILPTMHCRSQHCWELLHPFAYHCQHARNNSQHYWRNNVGSCCVRLHTALHTVTEIQCTFVTNTV